MALQLLLVVFGGSVRGFGGSVVVCVVLLVVLVVLRYRYRCFFGCLVVLLVVLVVVANQKTGCNAIPRTAHHQLGQLCDEAVPEKLCCPHLSSNRKIARPRPPSCSVLGLNAERSVKQWIICLHAVLQDFVHFFHPVPKNPGARWEACTTHARDRAPPRTCARSSFLALSWTSLQPRRLAATVFQSGTLWTRDVRAAQKYTWPQDMQCGASCNRRDTPHPSFRDWGSGASSTELLDRGFFLWTCRAWQPLSRLEKARH